MTLKSHIRVLILSVATASLAGHLVAAEDGTEFFEKKIRPVLVENCYKCHSASEKVKGGLLLDTKEGALKGGDTGPAIVPGDPEKSLLIKAIRHTDPELKMPKEKLPSDVIANFETWVKMGAPDPRTGKPAVTAFEAIMQNGKKHWAFQPVKKPEPPKVKNQAWVKSPVDNFILARLEEKNLKPAPPADKRTLIRRATFDLTGLPPTPEEVDAFVKDNSPDAFAKVVDRLLASPRYGERWGRHWLDVARYADTKGYLAGDEQRRFPYSYTYRDYVIRALNEDVPFDRFIIEQLAADQLDLGSDKRPLAALGYLTLGRRFLNNINDIIDDRIDVVCRGMMGLTVGCARCHDHKYDPVPTKDYYSLYGVFASSTEPAEKPLLGVNQSEVMHKTYLEERKKREDKLNNYRQQKLDEAMGKLRERVGDYLVATDEVSPATVKASAGKRRGGDKYFSEHKLDANVVRRWQDYLANQRKQHSPVFAPWFAFADLKDDEFAAKAGELATKFAANNDATKPLNPLVAKLFAGEAPKTLKEVGERYSKLFKECDGAQPQTDKDREPLRLVLRAPDAPTVVPAPENDSLLEGDRPRLRQLQADVEEVDATHPGAPPRAMSLVDANPHNVRVFVRGNPGNQGPEAPRQFLEILSGPKREPFKKGSGRLELAQDIASKDNPLTPRVMANRVWLLHFGQGLVRTPSDFGVRSDPPTHPELLDYLAASFMEQGWSLKKLHRLLMLSSTYQQSSDADPKIAKDYARIDASNSLLWHMNRHRLEFESMRDTLLAISGKLDSETGGLPVDLTMEPFSARRTVYGYIDRQNLPGMFRTFDFANPDASSAQRFTTTVPQQALFLMNSPFVLEQARSLAARKDVASIERWVDRVQKIYQLAYQRPATKEELVTAIKFIETENDRDHQPPTPPVWQYGYGEFDPTSNRVKQFTALPKFVNKQWQAGPKVPDPQLGYVLLNATGGHVGNDVQHAVIRRWTAPYDGAIAIDGMFSHGSDKGDGVRARIVSSRTGLAGEWSVHNKQAPAKVDRLEVKKGDTIDFVTDCITGPDNDSFNWVPEIKLLTPLPTEVVEGATDWNAQRDFSKPTKEGPEPLTAWQKFAQVILLSNETVFVD